MAKIDRPSWISRFARNYFNKNVFPYWCVVLADTVIVFLSTAFVYWAFHRTGVMYEHRHSLFYMMLVYSAMSVFSARIFRTYSGVVRYSGFVDLLKVCYANALTFILAMGSYYLFKALGVPALTERLVEAIRLLPNDAKVIVAGDFNDYADSPSLLFLQENGLHNITHQAQGTHGAMGTYRYEGQWRSIDHVLVSRALSDSVSQTYVNDAPFLLQEDKKYGGVKPLRTFNGLRYQRGFSDHLPLVVRFQ